MAATKRSRAARASERRCARDQTREDEQSAVVVDDLAGKRIGTGQRARLRAGPPSGVRGAVDGEPVVQGAGQSGNGHALEGSAQHGVRAVVAEDEDVGQQVGP